MLLKVRSTRFILALLLTAACPARGADVKRVLEPVASGIAEFVKGKGDTVVAISFTGPTTFPTGSANGLTQLLAEELKRHSIETRDRARLGVRGSFAPTPEGDVQIRTEIVDQFEEPLQRFVIRAVHHDQFISLLQPSVDFSKLPMRTAAADSDQDRRAQLLGSLRQPPTRVQGVLVKPSATSQFGVELLVDGTPRKPVLREGLPFIALNRNENYQIQLFNGSGSEVAAEVEVDGLNVYHFSQLRDLDSDRPKYRYFIIPSGRSTVSGWHISDRFSKKFTITPLEESAAAKLGLRQKIGTVTIKFHSCWNEGELPPANEPPSPDFNVEYVPTKRNQGPVPEVHYEDREAWQTQATTIGLGPQSFGTGLGADVRTDLKGVSRVIGEIVASVTIRYNNP